MPETHEDETDPDSHRVGSSPEDLLRDYSHHLRYTLARDAYTASDLNRYYALALAVRDRVIERWLATQQTHHRFNVKRVYYLSLEFLIGRLLGNNVINMHMEETCRKAMSKLRLDWNKLRDYEVDAGLGNGGLGRLAACFLDSLSTMEIPAVGYGLRYDYGIFNQSIVRGYQVEKPDAWLKHGYPWEVARPEYSFEVHFGGRVEFRQTSRGPSWDWLDTRVIVGMPYDLPVVGYGGHTVNTLRLWSARAPEEFDLDDFNRGSYVEAVENKVLAENLTKVLYPNDNVDEGKELRLKQQYFFVSCSLQDILRRFKASRTPWEQFPDKVSLQMNDTHPAILVPELMRLLMDREGMDWDLAWSLVTAATGYTNHTVLPEALEKWSVDLFAHLLPRHLQIIYEINSRFLREVAIRFPLDSDRLRRMSLIDEGPHRLVRMANLAIVGSHSVNGVAALHTQILKRSVFRDFAELRPEQFNNKTNGITPRRWLLKANPGLAALITQAIGDGWVTQLDELRRLEPSAGDPAFLEAFRKVKQQNKLVLANHIKEHLGITIHPESLYDVQVKRLHEYKRQLLLALYTVILYARLKDNPGLDVVPRTFLFAAKAAPGYYMAKLIIKLIHQIGAVINNDPGIGDRLKVVFLPNYRVSLAERIIPAANVSEQISLAGTEASGTGNMKFMLNGALTVGTLDGANIEIAEEAGAENVFIFGMNAEEVDARRPHYNPWDLYHQHDEIRRAVQYLERDFFNMMEPGIFRPIVNALLAGGDHYMILADLVSYLETQDRVDALYRDEKAWDRKAVLNVSRAGKFSSDRTIGEYAREIWKVEPFPMPRDTVSE
ncbi:MAG: glycogen/starch/alpha-glucan phosphorylase [Spirochaetes bacterium]|nr:glycogen/starch/alpha-glucan phosphorylase [Spirochaetota bacterium]